MRFGVTVLTCLALLGGLGVSGAATAEKEFCGVGVQLKPKGDALVVERILPGSAAEKAGLPAGCCLVSVDGKPVKGMAVQDVVALIRGPEGAAVSLVVVEDLGLTKTFTITRTRMTSLGLETLPGVYSYQDDPAALVTIERVAGAQFAIRCPQKHWSGVGIVGNDTFKGVFQMEDHPEVLADFRGAVCFFRMDFQFGNRLLLRSRFNFFDKADTMLEKTLIRKSDAAEPARPAAEK